MKMADILRKLADKLDNVDQGVDDPTADNATQQRLEPVKTSEPELDDSPVMVPPLQAKLEILKKSEGIPNVYDDEEQKPDELAMLKQRAGITPCQQSAAEDNDITG
jgi:hypothetical protein